MAFLGRGEPGATTPANRTISYMSVNGMESLSKSCERDDTGLYNVAFERGQSGPHQMCYASTHGFQNALGAQMFLSSNIKNHEWLRPVTALGATATGEEPGNKTGYFVTQAIDPLVPGRLTCSRSWAESWNWMPLGGDVPKGGLVSICGEHRNGKLWWLLFTDGLYSSKDEGKTLKKILDPYGRKQ